MYELNKKTSIKISCLSSYKINSSTDDLFVSTIKIYTI